MHQRLWLRIVFGYLALQSVQIGAWALLAPRSFYDGFPGFGRAWVSVDGPFNEHLVRDVGALNLAYAALAIAAAVWLSRQLIVVAAAAALLWGVPHFLYHLVNTDDLSTGDVAVSLTGLAIFVALPISALWLVRQGPLSSERDGPGNHTDPVGSAGPGDPGSRTAAGLHHR